MSDYGSWRFPHETLYVYRDALEFLRRVEAIAWPRGLGELKQQLKRAALSITLNVCEGRAQKMAGNSGANFYRIALGSAAECHGALEALQVVGRLELTEEVQLIRAIGGKLSALLRK